MGSPKPEERSDERYADQLKRLEHDREQILKDVSYQTSRLFPHLECQVRLRTKIAENYRDMQLKNAYYHYKSEVEQAWNEFERGKHRLLSTMLDMSTERRRRLDGIRQLAATTALMNNVNSPMILKKRRRGSRNNHIVDNGNGPIDCIIHSSKRLLAKPQHFINSLEGQGLVRVALTPDEVNADLEVIFRDAVSVKSNGYGAGGNATLLTGQYGLGGIVGERKGDGGGGTGDSQRVGGKRGRSRGDGYNGAGAAALFMGSITNRPDGITNKADKVHISKGTLHYFDSNFEKGDRVAVYNTRPKPSLRFDGVLVSVNAKEIIIRSGSGAASTPHRVFVSYLCSGRYLLKLL